MKKQQRIKEELDALARVLKDNEITRAKNANNEMVRSNCKAIANMIEAKIDTLEWVLLP